MDDFAGALGELVELLTQPIDGFVHAVYRQGSAPPKPLPDRFFTYWNVASHGVSFYANKRRGRVEYYSICLYERQGDPVAARRRLGQVVERLDGAGWIMDGLPMDIPAEPGYIGLNLRAVKRVDLPEEQG